MMLCQFFARLLLVFAFTVNTCQAASLETMSSLSRGSEFYVGTDTGKALITVNLIDGVRNPGVYHLPVDTSLAQLLAFAGGALEKADLSSITVRHQGRNPEVTRVDLESDLRRIQPLSTLREGDMVQITSKSGAESTLQWATIGSALASIALSIVLISQAHRN